MKFNKPNKMPILRCPLSPRIMNKALATDMHEMMNKKPLSLRRSEDLLRELMASRILAIFLIHPLGNDQKANNNDVIYTVKQKKRENLKGNSTGQCS